MRVDVVIGAQYGDEGKGLVTDYLSSGQTCVVRFNGGSQAGHTVVTPDGQRHVFKHVGAGTFRGARTYLSKHFIVNPIIFEQELGQLGTFGILPEVDVDLNARVTTPWDMMINMSVEDVRGPQRHGSVGFGINETVVRCETPEFDLRVSDLLLPRVSLKRKLDAIRIEWVSKRCNDLGIEFVGRTSDVVCNRFIESVGVFASYTHRNPTEALMRFPHLVFEGAQGLRLDERAAGFPHVTRSRTGLPNVMDLLSELGDYAEAPQVYYVTRAYTTRHGAGPLAGETSGHPYGWEGHETNYEGPYQGHFRYAKLDPVALTRVVCDDIVNATRLVTVHMAVTCLDQVPGSEWVRLQEAMHELPPIAIQSYGQTRANACMLEAV